MAHIRAEVLDGRHGARRASAAHRMYERFGDRPGHRRGRTRTDVPQRSQDAIDGGSESTDAVRVEVGEECASGRTGRGKGGPDLSRRVAVVQRRSQQSSDGGQRRQPGVSDAPQKK
eukprot:7052603-Alexandrium_andersonii.AAC.1